LSKVIQLEIKEYLELLEAKGNCFTFVWSPTSKQLSRVLTFNCIFLNVQVLTAVEALLPKGLVEYPGFESMFESSSVLNNS
jgi:hypothetical protein